MPDRDKPNQPLARRAPRQARSQHKVGLMLEAAIQLLETGDIAALTTNAVAAKAGVSIGTLYQYFSDKQALLDALVGRELGAMSDQVVASVEHAGPVAAGDRIRTVVRAVANSYGGRGRAHRLLMEHALSHAPGQRLSPLYERLVGMFTTAGIAVGTGRAAHRLSPAQAFVLTHTMAGVLRAMAASAEPPPVQEVEDALVQMVTRYVAGLIAPSGKGHP